MKKIIDFMKQEAVLSVAVALALVSMLFILPDEQYLEYIDFRTLGILFCLMAVMAGFQEIGVFRLIAEKLLKKVSNVFGLVVILVMLCFFFSMLITNDVALITFVPFTFIVLQMIGEKQERQLIVPVVVMQTIAANLGSMLTPIGNPQNLYLYGRTGYSFGEFILLMLPYTVLAFVMLLGYCAILGRMSETKKIEITFAQDSAGIGGGVDSKKAAAGKDTSDVADAARKKSFAILRYSLLFVLSLLTVVRVLPYWITLLIVVIVMAIFDRKLFAGIDYALLITFVGFFVFIGNMGRVPVFYNLLQNIIGGNEVVTAVIASQVISNVPAALLLSGFTQDLAGLIVGTNLGGLGTLIASMASLISYKYIGKSNKCSKGEYFRAFTVWNIIFLAVMLAAWWLLSR